MFFCRTWIWSCSYRNSGDGNCSAVYGEVKGNQTADYDTISRQAVKELLNNNELPYHINPVLWKDLNELPPIQPKRGKWIKISPANIYECSECGKSVMTNDICAYDFCHGCGADMRGEQK